MPLIILKLYNVIHSVVTSLKVSPDFSYALVEYMRGKCKWKL